MLGSLWKPNFSGLLPERGESKTCIKLFLARIGLGMAEIQGHLSEFYFFGTKSSYLASMTSQNLTLIREQSTRQNVSKSFFLSSDKKTFLIFSVQCSESVQLQLS